MRVLRWLTVVAMLAIGVAALYVGGVGGLTTGSAASSRLLTSAALQTTVSQDIAATGSARSALSYGLAFGIQPALIADGSTGAASDGGTWQVLGVDVKLGDRVTSGQVLARADTTVLEAQLATAQTDLASAMITLQQAQDAKDRAGADLRKRLASDQDSVEVAKLNLRNAKATLADTTDAAPRRQARIGVIQATTQLRQAQQAVADVRDQLAGDLPDETKALMTAQASVTDLESQVPDLQQQIDLAVLHAPADGIVTAVAIVPGFLAPSGDAIVVAGAGLEVRANVTESDLPSVKVGQAATVTIAALGLDEAGTVTAVSPSTEVTSGSVVSFPVTVTLTDPDPAIRAGMSCDVTISIARADDVVAVPVAALQGRSGNLTVEVLAADGSTQNRPVTVGLVTETLAEIQSGVTAGEQVVTGTANTQTQVTGTSNQGAFGIPGAGGVPGAGFSGRQRDVQP